MGAFRHAVASLVLIRSILGKYECSKDFYDKPTPTNQVPVACGDSTFGSCNDATCCIQQRTCAYYQTGDTSPGATTGIFFDYSAKCRAQHMYLDVAKAKNKVPSPGDDFAITTACCSPTAKCIDYPSICTGSRSLIPTAYRVDAPATWSDKQKQDTCCEATGKIYCNATSVTTGKTKCANMGSGPSLGTSLFDLSKGHKRYVPATGLNFQETCCSDFTKATCFQWNAEEVTRVSGLTPPEKEVCPAGKIVNLKNSAPPDGTNNAATLSPEAFKTKCCVAKATCGAFACPSTHTKMAKEMCNTHSAANCTVAECCRPRNTCADVQDDWTWEKCPKNTFFDTKKRHVTWERVFQSVERTVDSAKAANVATQQAKCCTPYTEAKCFDWTSTAAIIKAATDTTTKQGQAQSASDAAPLDTKLKAALEKAKAAAKAAAAAHTAALTFIAAASSVTDPESYGAIGSAFVCPSGKFLSELSACTPYAGHVKITLQIYQHNCCTFPSSTVSCNNAKSPFVSNSTVVPAPTPVVPTPAPPAPTPAPPVPGGVTLAPPVPTPAPPAPTPAPPAPTNDTAPTNKTEKKFCVNIETGTEKFNDGRLDVRIHSDGAYQKQMLGKRFALAEIVMTPCFLKPVDYVEVKNPTGDSWTGSIQYSSDKRATWNLMNCSLCTGSFGSVTVVNKNMISADVVTGRRLSPAAGSSCDTGGWCKTVPLETNATFCAKWTEVCPLKWQDKVGRKDKIPCSGVVCKVSDCCYQPINCASWTCPATQPKRPGADGVLCFGSQCTDSQCCQPVTITPISCASWSLPCPVNQMAKALTSICVGAQCVASDCCAVPAVPYLVPAVRRRRRNGDMHSCRRRNGREDNPEGFSCGLHSFVRSLPTTFVNRRRRNGKNACRRRNGHHDTSAGFTCVGHSIVLVDGMRKFASYDVIPGMAAGTSAAFSCLFVVGMTSAIGIVAVLRRRAASHDVGHEQLPHSETDADSEKA